MPMWSWSGRPEPSGSSRSLRPRIRSCIASAAVHRAHRVVLVRDRSAEDGDERVADLLLDPAVAQAHLLQQARRSTR